MHDPVFGPVEVPSTYRETIARLGTAIRVGLLPPRTRLPPERELADRLGISRSTLRQALASLTASGHLISVRGRSGGTFVAQQPPLCSDAPYPLDRAPALLDWRMALELGAVQLAAERSEPAAMDALEESADECERPEVLADWVRFRRADAAFHLRLAEATGSPRIVDAVTKVHGELCDLLVTIDRDAGAREATVGEHRHVVEAVRSGDAAAAREAMHVHLIATERAVLQLSTSAT